MPGDEEKIDVRKKKNVQCALEKGWVRSNRDKQKTEAELWKALLLKRGTYMKECMKREAEFVW